MAEMTIKRFNVVSVARLYSLLLFLLGLLIGVLYGLMFMLVGATMSLVPQGEGAAALGGAGTIIIGLLIMIGFPLMYAVIGFIAGALVAVAYNAAARMVGGVQFEVEAVNQGYAPPMAPTQWAPNH